MKDATQSARVRLFGAPKVETAAGVRHLSPYQLALLALVYAEGRITRSRLAKIMWERDIDPTVRHRMRQLVLTTRKRSDVDVLRIEGDTFLSSPTVRSDLAEFKEDLEALRLAQAADALSRGFLDAFPATVSDTFDDWRSTTASRLTAELVRTATAQWKSSSQVGDWESARDAAEALYLMTPADPLYARQVIEARGRVGKLRAAEVAYAEYRDRLSASESPCDGVEEVIRRVRAIPNEMADALQHRPPPFVGRDEALQRLRPIVDEVMGGKFSLGLIIGEAGIGKTRLMQEVRRTAHLEGIRCLSARSVELERTISLNPVLDALSSLDMEAHLAALGEPWRTVIGNMLPAGSLMNPVGDMPSIQESNLSRRLLDAFSLLFQQLADEQPTILFLDDLQWADATTVAAIQFFQRRWQDAAFGVVGTIRPEAVGPRDPSAPYLDATQGPSAHRITIGEMSPEEAEQLVRSVGGTVIDDAMMAHLFDLAGFHPLFLIELAQDYLGRRLRLPGEGEGALPIPVSLKEILSARSKALSPEARAMASFLAAASKSMRLSDLAELTELSIDETADAAEDLCRHRIAEVERDRVRIGHELFGSAIYGELSEVRRAVLHRKLANQVKSRRRDDAPDELAIHLDRAGDVEEAARYAWLAGARDMDRGAVAEAAQFFELAARNDPDPRRSAEATGQMAIALHLNRDMARAAPVLELASSRLRSVGSQAEARRLEIRRVEAMAEGGNTTASESIERLAAIEKEATEAEDWEAVALALDVEVQMLLLHERLQEVGQREEALQHLTSGTDKATKAVAQSALSVSLMLRSNQDAFRAAERAVRLTGDGALDRRLTSLNRFLIVLFHQGRLLLPENKQYLDEAGELASRSGDLLQRFSFESNLAVGFLDAGDLDTAEVRFNRAENLLGHADMTFPRVNLACNRGELALAQGDFDLAEESFAAASSLAGVNAPKYTSDAVNAGIGLCALENGLMAEAGRRERALCPPPSVWYYDPTVTISFRARLLERRGNHDQAIAALGMARADVEGRLVSAWLKLSLIHSRLLIRRSSPSGLEIAEKGLAVATELDLKIRAAQFNHLAGTSHRY